MEKTKLIELIEKGYSYEKISKETGKANSTVSYWLKKHGLKTKIDKHSKRSFNNEGLKRCPKCNEFKSDNEFYKRTTNEKRGQITSYCKNCNTHYRRERMIETKLKMMEYKGGKCVKCGLDSKDIHYSVFDFHHLNPLEKDLKWDKIKYLGKGSWYKIKIELDKCELLCANCHRITHSEMNIGI
jgi:predicted GNAT family acetyltransferase